jgi:EAL domain-containing protein (putative c-di-GMP-specific phosphodiesterase class I)/PleD family two-component response regulator
MKNDIWAATQPFLASEASALDAPRSPLLSAKVMMVDDEPLMTELIQTHLEEEGYGNFVSCNDPRQALEMLRRDTPSVLLLDLMMPQMSGFELLEAIRADRALRYTPVIVLTASTGADAKLRALQLGATDFLSKPVDSSELVLRLRNTLAFQQYHDRLINFDVATGLPNERLFDKGIGEMLGRRELVGGLVGLFSIKVPECRQLRETIDQASADTLAKTLARRLERFASELTTNVAMATSTERAPRVARLSIDQFAVLIEGLADADAVERVVRQMLAALAEPVVFGLHTIVPKAQMGIALAPTDGESAAALRKNADLAVSHADAQGAIRYKFSSPELNAKSYQKLSLGLKLRGAAQRGELRLHYQPKVDFGSGRIIGCEALVRWQHPDEGLLAPSRFIALAEELDLIRELGQWVMEQACRDAASWVKAGHTPIKVAINVAKPQFIHGDLRGEIRQALFDSGLPAEQLVVELTESMLMDDAQSAMALMRELKKLGVSLSVDDFGTGYSSLSYLTRLPIDELKIDRSFVMPLPSDGSDAAVVRTVIELGHRLGMSVVAEGVETAGQFDALKQYGCDTFQGFLFSKPVPADEFVGLLSRGA